MEKITKAEWDMIKKHRKGTSEINVSEITVDVDEPESFEVEDVSDLVLEEKEKEQDYYTCSECGFDKITKDMLSCPKCKADLKW